MSIIEEFVNQDMLDLGIKSIQDYDNKLMINKYYQCYSSIDENEYIMKNYIVSPEIIKNLEKSTWLSCEVGKKLTEFEDEFFSKLNFNRLRSNFEYLQKDSIIIPTNMRLQYVIPLILLKTEAIMTNEKWKFEKKSCELEMNIITEINKLYLENKKSFGLFFKNKIYYELYVITKIILEDIKWMNACNNNSNNLIKVENYDKTKSKIKSLFTSRILSLTNNNLLLLKIRRVYCALFEMKELEQRILKDIMKIYRSNKDDVNLELYLIAYTNNFEKTKKKDELYTILKSYLHLRSYTIFENLFMKYKALIDNNEENRQTKYKFMIVYFKNSQAYRLAKEMIGLVQIYMDETNMLNRAEYELFQTINKPRETFNQNNMPSYEIKLSDAEKIEYSNLCMLLIDYEILDINPGNNIDYPSYQIDSLIQLVRLMVIVSSFTNEKKILFKILPLTINNLLKLENLIGSDVIAMNTNFTPLAKVIRKWKSDKIYFIAGQLTNMYSASGDPHMYQSAVELLARYVNEIPHVNAYWLSSFLKTDEQEIGQLNKNYLESFRETLRKAYGNRKSFGEDILSKLDPRNMTIIKKYMEFLGSLRKLQEQIVNGEKKDAKITIDKINSLISKQGVKLILPKLSNMSRNFNFDDDSSLCEVFQSLQVIPNHDIISINKCNNKQFKFRNESGYVDNFEFISSLSHEYVLIQSKDKPIKLTFITQAKKSYHFLIKGSINDAVKEIKAYDLISVFANIFSYEGLATNYNIRLKQNNFVPIGTHSVMIEWLDEMETLRAIMDKQYKKHGVLKGSVQYNEKEHQEKAPKIFDSWGSEGSLLYEFFLNEYADPNKWYEVKQKYITSYAIWSMVGYVIGLGDRHSSNTMISVKGEICQIDFGWMLGLQRSLRVPETIDFRFTKNIRRAFGIFEEQGYFLFISEQILKAIFKHLDSIETKIMSFITDPITLPVNR